MPEKLESQFQFILELEKLKAVLRKTKPLGLSRYENSAEHSWQVCILALTLSEYASEPVDISKVVKLLLLHDIAEIDVGDTIVYALGDDNSIKENESIAASRIFGLLPEEQRQQYLSLWHEYEENQSAESRFAHAMDRLMPVLQNLYNGGQSWLENGIKKEQVLDKNLKIGEGAPLVWARLKEKINLAAQGGLLR
jgi:putative hydrolase of HD superfamily